MTVATMTVPAPPAPMTADEFIALPNAGDYELIDGILTKRMPMGAKASAIASQVNMLLGLYRREHGGWVMDSETSYCCFGSPRTLRRADVSFVLPGRFPGEVPPDGYVILAPDLAVEVVSTHDNARELETKVVQFLNAGVRLVWIVYPDTQTVHVRRPDGTVKILGDSQQLSGEDVLPQFSCPIRELFPTVQKQ